VNLAFHEFGHIFFGLLGGMVGVWGGTVMQLGVPLGSFLYFHARRDTAGVFLVLSGLERT
jgi:hypothetical protein